VLHQSRTIEVVNECHTNKQTSNVQLSRVVCGSIESTYGCTSQSPPTLTIRLSHAIAMEGPLEQALSTPRALMSSTLLPLVSLTIPLLVLIISNILRHRPLPPINLSPRLGFPTLKCCSCGQVHLWQFLHGELSSVGPEPLCNDNMATALMQRQCGYTAPVW